MKHTWRSEDYSRPSCPFSPNTMWVLGIKLRPFILATSFSTCSAISPSHPQPHLVSSPTTLPWFTLIWLVELCKGKSRKPSFRFYFTQATWNFSISIFKVYCKAYTNTEKAVGLAQMQTEWSLLYVIWRPVCADFCTSVFLDVRIIKVLFTGVWPRAVLSSFHTLSFALLAKPRGLWLSPPFS